MAHLTLQAGAPNLPLSPGMKLVLESVDPTSETPVTGVTVTRWTIYGYDASTGVVPLSGPYLLTPAEPGAGG